MVEASSEIKTKDINHLEQVLSESRLSEQHQLMVKLRAYLSVQVCLYTLSNTHRIFNLPLRSVSRSNLTYAGKRGCGFWDPNLMGVPIDLRVLAAIELCIRKASTYFRFIPSKNLHLDL